MVLRVLGQQPCNGCLMRLGMDNLGRPSWKASSHRVVVAHHPAVTLYFHAHMIPGWAMRTATHALTCNTAHLPR
jgi:hypothetical protein